MINFALLGADLPTALPEQLARYAALRPVPLAAVDDLRQAPLLDVVVLAGRVDLSVEQAALLVGFVRRGGGLVCAGDALDGCHDHPELMALLGAPAGERAPLAELIVRPLDHPLAARRDGRWVVQDRLLLAAPPPDVTPLLEVSWRMGRYPAAYTRRVGPSQVVVITIGTTPATQADPHFVDLLGRAVLHAGNAQAAAPIKVALLGYGAIGREHGDALLAVPGLALDTICDRNPQRLEQARALYGGVRLAADLHALADDPAIDLVIVATPPNTHFAAAQTLLEAGKHVVVEKPFCITTAEADALIALAADRRRLLTVYQNRRWDADFLAIKQAIGQGLIGEVFSVETFIGGYSHPCDYWHSDAAISGGVFYDWGSHYLDWILDLVPEPVVAVSASQHKRVWHDVTNADHSAIRLRFAGGVEAEFIHSDIAAALKPKWYILGTRGAIVAEWRHETIRSRRWSGDLIEERLQAAESPSIVRVFQREPGDTIHAQTRTLPAVPAYPFHRNLADHLLLGAPLAVLPDAARRNIAVMEAATRSVAADADWIAPR